MNPRRSFSRLALALGTGWLVLAAGCQVFVAKHKVLVDAIAAPGLAAPAGQSYRLVAKRSVVTQARAQVEVVKACVDAALTRHGLFEAPEKVAPDIVIEVGYGVDASPRVDPAARETFLQLSARANPERAMDRATGPELWDVRVGVLGLIGRIENALPLLCSVAADYAGTDTKFETQIEIPQNSPEVKTVRETAIKALEEKAATAPPPQPKPAGTSDSGEATASAATGAK